MKNVVFALAAIAATFGLGAVSEAGLLSGSQSFGSTAIVPNGTSQDLLSISNFTTLTFETGSSQSGNFVGYPTNQVLNNSPLNTGSLATFSMGSADFGTFTASSGFELVSPPHTRTFDLFGNFVPGSNSHWAGLTGQSAELLITFNQVGGSGNAISASATLAVPPSTQLPEPGSMTLLGIGAVGLVAGAIRGKRRKIVA